MSVEHMAMVFAAQGLDGGEKLLLLAYTNYTDPHGYCWPGEERLAEDTGTSVSTVRRTKKKLIGRNLVKSERRAETSNLARVNLPLLASMARPRKAYDDNEVERLSFDGPAPASTSETDSDLRTVQSDLYPSQGSDLRTEQSDLDHRSDCSDGQVRLTCATGQSDLQSLSDPSGRTISRPSVPAESAEGQDGGTDGAKVPSQISRNPGVDLLSAIGAEKPEFLLTGKTLQDQGMAVAGMLLEGWTPEQLRQVIAGRPLPDQITTTVGAIVSSRLKQALAGPVPHSAQAAWEPFSKRAETPTPDAWTADTVAPHKHAGECEGDDGLCGRPTEPGAAYCPRCREDVMA
ncbi:helix-turn-helix domain-containing protein [Streptomyces prasinopilosus]|uniref:helix-turn-helix domain-containing protein n=1 Tax=Streptomyces prasinopilosus TaxID=67344 RepID=UPI0006EB2CA9|nr:helix-turn-helix domain-containing protein [Streptomyces prasinopilosus]